VTRAARRSLLVFAGTLLLSGLASARGHTRRLFEPGDLNFDDPGVVDIDLQFGIVRSQGPWRLVIPDAEIDIGVASNLELSVNGAFAIEGAARGPFTFDHVVVDALWPALKLGILDTRSSDAGSAFALGVALGPKLPAGSGQHGLGAEGLFLLGFARGGTHAVGSLGGFADPRLPDGSRATAIEGGLDFSQDLDTRGRFAFTSELGAVRFFSGDPAQLTLSAGGAYSPRPWLDLSLVVLAGLLGGSDRYGMLFGVSPKVFANK